MTDKQAGWVVVKADPTFEMVEALADKFDLIDCDDGVIQGAIRAVLAASPRYEPGDAVEAAYQAWDRCTSPSKLVAMRAALTAAFPELLARIEALEREVDELNQRIGGLK